MCSEHLVTGASEFEVLTAAIEVSDGGEVEICSLDIVRGSLIESEVSIAVCVAVIERACVQRDLERLGVAWAGLVRYAKVLGPIVLESRSVTFETSIWSLLVVGAVGSVVESYKRVEGLKTMSCCIADRVGVA